MQLFSREGGERPFASNANRCALYSKDEKNVQVSTEMPSTQARELIFVREAPKTNHETKNVCPKSLKQKQGFP